MGTRFIASSECGAAQEYKDKVVECGPEDIVYTDKVSGVKANFIAETVPSGEAGGPEQKRWKDIWSAGHGVAEVKAVKPIEEIVEDLIREYHDSVTALS